MSIHSVDIVKIDSFENHPDPETTKLGVVSVGGFKVIVNKEQFEPGLFAYIQPDSMVPVTREDFAFLAPRAGGRDMYRVRVMKLRGFYSQGLLIPAPAGFNEGDDVAEFLGVEHYEPPVDTRTGGQNVRPPRHKDTSAGEVFVPVYDVENYNRFVGKLTNDDEVVATEKVHGTNFRATCVDGELFVGSRTLWKAEDDTCLWWVAIRNHPEIVEFLKANEGMVVYGEAYGRVQSLRYGEDNNVKVMLFDILRGGEWVNWDESQEIAGKWNLPWVQLVYRGAFDEGLLKNLAEQDSIMPKAPKGSIREGLVVKPVVERIDPRLGRVQLKMVSNRYLDKSKD